MSSTGVHRVVQWATGTTGLMSLRAVIDRPELDLVGLRVYDPAKVGVDAGTLVGRSEVGVPATSEREDIVVMDADVVLYMGKVELDLVGCFDDVAALLASGKNVIATGSRFVHPRSLSSALADKLDAACASGKSSFLGLGLYPGFVAETLAPTLSRLSASTTRIEVREVLDYSTYASTDLMFATMGFGHTPDDPTPLLADPNRAAMAWVGSATLLAGALGLEIRSTEGYRDVAVTDRALEVAAGTVPAGTVGAMRFGVVADCGDTTINVEHVTRMAPDLAPDWPAHEGYEITYIGSPTMTCRLLLGREGEDHAEQGCLATAMHAVNAIDAVVAAPPGLHDLSTIGVFTR